MHPKKRSDRRKARMVIIAMILLAITLTVIFVIYRLNLVSIITVFVCPLLVAGMVCSLYYSDHKEGPWAKVMSLEDIRVKNWMVIIASDPDNKYISYN